MCYALLIFNNNSMPSAYSKGVEKKPQPTRVCGLWQTNCEAWTIVYICSISMSVPFKVAFFNN